MSHTRTEEKRERILEKTRITNNHDIEATAYLLNIRIQVFYSDLKTYKIKSKMHGFPQMPKLYRVFRYTDSHFDPLIQHGPVNPTTTEEQERKTTTEKKSH